MARAVTPRAKEARRRERTRLHNYYDYSLLMLVIFIVAFGLIMIYSASSFTAQTSQKYNYDAAYFLKKQAGAAVLGIVAMLMVSKIDYRRFIKKLPVIRVTPAVLLYITATILQMLVLFIGDDTNGAKRWIRLGPIGFQPSEITKIAVIVFTSYMIYLTPLMMDSMFGFVKVAIFMAVPIGLVLKENMSTAIVLILIMIGICYVASRKKWYYILSFALAGGVLGLVLVFGDGFRMERIQIWQNVETHAKGYQILQGLYAIASGGLFGTGLGQSMQKLGFIPESYNDMIFSIVCEELGLFGAVVVIVMFLLIIWRIFTIAISAPDLFGALLCVGVLVHVSVQVIINIAVVTNFIPSTGIPLPFISYGGTSVSILLAEMGIVLSVSNQIKGY